MMVFVKEALTWENRPARVMNSFLVLLQPFAPHLAEELSSKIRPLLNREATTIAYEPWPLFDDALLAEDEIVFPVQVNGKLRDKITLSADANEGTIKEAALASTRVQPFLKGKSIRKIIVVKQKLVNIVAH